MAKASWEAGLAFEGDGWGWGCPYVVPWLCQKEDWADVDEASSGFTVLYLCRSLAIRVSVLRDRLPFLQSMGREKVTEEMVFVGLC